MANNARHDALERLQQSNLKQSNLTKGDFDLTADTANERTLIAEFEAPYPIVFREKEIRLAVTVVESFTTTATADTETFNLSQDIANTANTQAFVLYTDGDGSGSGFNVVQPDSVDYDADTFTYTDSANAENLYAYYVARDPLKIELWKEKPGTTGSIGEMLYDDYTADFHVRNQNDEAPRMEFNKSKYQAVVPKDWKVRMYSDGDYSLAWEDGNSDGTTATNAIINFPAFRAPRNISGLSREVTQDIGRRQ